jgi:hypothetical protein
MAHARHGLEISRERKQQGAQAWTLCQLGELHARCDPPEVERAEGCSREALAEELGMRPLQAHCHSWLGMLYGEIGRQDEACTELQTAIELYRAMEMTFWLPQAEATLA